MDNNYVVNVKTKAGTIITVRGDNVTDFENNINALIGNGVNNSIAAMEELFLGVQSSNSRINTVVDALSGTVISETPWTTEQKAFAPVVPPTGSIGASTGTGTATKSCIHGVMTKRADVGPYGPYRAFMCPTDKGTVGQCKPIYLKPSDPEFATF